MNQSFDFFYFETNMGPIWIRRDQIIAIQPIDHQSCKISCQQPRAGNSIWTDFTVHHESSTQVIHRLATSQFTRPDPDKPNDTAQAMAEDIEPRKVAFCPNDPRHIFFHHEQGRMTCKTCQAEIQIKNV
jgi:hypothetical protein